MKKVLAFDFGASSGRAILGTFDGEKITLEEIHRFSNDPVKVGHTFYWDVLRLFHENKQGKLVAITDTLAKNEVNIRALSIAETEAFGILRLIVNEEEAAVKALTEAGYLLKVTEVVGVKIGDAPGKLSAALKALNTAGINMEYLYAFMARTERHAYVVLRVENNAEAETVLEQAGFHIITDADVNKL